MLWQPLLAVIRCEKLLSIYITFCIFQVIYRVEVLNKCLSWHDRLFLSWKAERFWSCLFRYQDCTDFIIALHVWSAAVVPDMMCSLPWFACRSGAKVERSVLYIKCFSGVWGEGEIRNRWVKITRRQLKCNLKKIKGEFPKACMSFLMTALVSKTFKRKCCFYLVLCLKKKWETPNHQNLILVLHCEYQQTLV